MPCILVNFKDASSISAGDIQPPHSSDGAIIHCFFHLWNIQIPQKKHGQTSSPLPSRLCVELFPLFLLSFLSWRERPPNGHGKKTAFRPMGSKAVFPSKALSAGDVPSGTENMRSDLSHAGARVHAALLDKAVRLLLGHLIAAHEHLLRLGDQSRDCTRSEERRAIS